MLLLPLDDLLAITRGSRSGLDRCLRLHGAGEAEGASPRTQGLQDYRPGFLHIDVKYLPQMSDETKRRYLQQAAYETASLNQPDPWVYVYFGGRHSPIPSSFCCPRLRPERMGWLLFRRT